MFGTCDSDGIGDPDPSPAVLAYDSPVVAPINTSTDGQFFSFFVNNQSMVQLNVLSTTNFYDPSVTILDESGVVVMSQACTGQDVFGNGIRCSFSMILDVTQTQKYSLILFDSGTNETGGAELSIFCLFGSCDSDGDSNPDPEPSLISFVSTNDGATTSATDGLFNQFYGIQEARVRIDLVSTTNFLDPVLQVRDPFGAVFLSSSCTGQDVFGNGIKCNLSVEGTLPSTGFYDIVVFDSGTNEAGGVRFTAHCIDGTCDSDADGLVDPEPSAVNYGSVHIMPISPATDSDSYNIEGTVGDDIQVTVVSQTNFFDPKLEVFTPDGDPLSQSSCTGQDVFGNGIRCSFSLPLNDLPSSGTYRLVLSDVSTNETGSYELGLQCIFGDCPNPEPPIAQGDNCIEYPNGPAQADAGGNVQLDSDGDGIGNGCDADIDNNCAVNFLDLDLFSDEFLSAGPVADFDGSGFVNFLDLSIFAGQFLADFTQDNPSGVPNICQ